MTTRVVPFADRHLPRPLPVVDVDAVTEPVTPFEATTEKPAKRGKAAKCPQCGAGPDRRVVSGLGAVQSVTCEACAWEFPPKELSDE